MDIKGKNAVITGISKGIGRACAEKLLEKGANVAGWGKSEPPYNHENLHFFETDVKDENSVKESRDKTLKQFNNEVDILINNAGLGYFGYFEEMPLEEYREMMQTNVDGVFFVTRNLIPTMKEKGQGHIINLSSIAGLQTNPQGGVYSATKYAVTAFTDALFKELRDYGIKVTGIHPGSVKTDFFENAPGVDAHDYMMKPSEVADTIIHSIESPQNYLVSQVVMRPLQPKGPQK